MRRHRANLPTRLRPGSQRDDEQGIVIVLVAVFMLFVIGAMAALSIDVVTLYTARSEAQLAADAAALAAARVLANSGATSDTIGASMGVAQARASSVATQVARQNLVGGANLTAAEVLPPVYGGTITNPTVTVTVQKTDLPTFFARIWGRTAIAVSASATAEAYNPSPNPLGAPTSPPLPVAPMCVKPWLLPNIDPSNPGNPIFDTTAGTIKTTTLLGWTTPLPPPPNPTRLKLACGPPTTLNPGDCSTLPAPAFWQYYPGDPASFPAPTQALPACVPVLTKPYQESVAGCIQTPISCNSQVNIDTSIYDTRNAETAAAVTCLTHAAADKGDKVDLTGGPNPPFQFLAGDDNPIAGLAGNDVMVSDSLVTVPVFNSGGAAPTNPVTIIGFVQLFLAPQGLVTPPSGHMRTTVINLAGCGTNATGTAILGNGASPVAVRLISP